jgi:hypothetical protein
MSDEIQTAAGGIERRVAPRVELHIDVKWMQDGFNIKEATMSDLSRTGCFILSGDKPKPKTSISLIIPSSETENLTLQGEVAYLVAEIGFAVEFIVVRDDKWKIEKLAQVYDLPEDA